ncbi:MAG: sugar ABC transporter permease [Lachnospiraceae bacterium]|nr:sugar ABC transporter permease [Lachnospiraceae bacterium]
MKKRKLSKTKIHETLELTMLALPGIVLLFIFNYLPISGVLIAFKDYNPNKGIWGSPWVGFDNFKFFFTSQDAVRTIRNTVGYSLAFIIFEIITGVTLAILFYNLRNQKALKFYNTVVILPRFLSMVIVAYIVYALLSPTSGVFNAILRQFGADGINWYGEPVYWPFILTFVHIWCTVGMKSILYYASLVGIDTGLLESARMDGANKWQETWHIVIPHLIPLIIIQTIMSMGHIFNGDFGLNYQVTKNIGALYPTTDIINTYTFRALQEASLERGAAVGLFQNGAGCIMLILVNAIVRKVRPEDSLF